jgi:hypothetical protein
MLVEDAHAMPRCAARSVVCGEVTDNEGDLVCAGKYCKDSPDSKVRRACSAGAARRAARPDAAPRACRLSAARAS